MINIPRDITCLFDEINGKKYVVSAQYWGALLSATLLRHQAGSSGDHGRNDFSEPADRSFKFGSLVNKNTKLIFICFIQFL